MLTAHSTVSLLLTAALLSSAGCQSESQLEGTGSEHAKPRGPARVTGVWSMESDLQGRTIPANLVLQRSDSREMTGVWESMGQEMELVGVTYVDEVLRFTRTMGEGGAELRFEGRVVDGELQGMQYAGEREIPTVGRRANIKDSAPDVDAPSRNSAASEEAHSRELEADFDRYAIRAAPRDGFDVLHGPEMVVGSDAETVREDEFVLGVLVGGEARAYPIGALGTSELINDVCGETPIAASW